MGAGAVTRRRGKYPVRAIPTEMLGRKFASKLEARVYLVLWAEKAADERIYCQPRFPLFNLNHNDAGLPLYFNPDFVIVGPDGVIHRCVDAKSPTRISPEWLRGKKAFEALMGLPVEEMHV